MDKEDKVNQSSNKEEMIKMYEGISGMINELKQDFRKLQTEMDHLVLQLNNQDKMYIDLYEKIEVISLYINSNSKRDLDIDKLACDIVDVNSNVSYMLNTFNNKIRYLETFIDKQSKIIIGKEKSNTSLNK